MLVLVPIVLMFVGAVRTGTFVDPRAQFSLRSLTAVYTTLPYLKILAVTVGASLLVSLVACVIGIGLAWLLARTDLPARGLMENAVIAPLYLSPFVGALAWLILGSPNAGLLNVLARDLLGVQGTMINVMTAGGVILVMALYNVPYAYMTVSAALKGMDPSMEEASLPERRRHAGDRPEDHLPGGPPVDRLGLLLRLRADLRHLLDPGGARRHAGAALPGGRHLPGGRDLPARLRPGGGDRHAPVLDLAGRRGLLPLRLPGRDALRHRDRPRLPHPPGQAARLAVAGDRS